MRFGQCLTSLLLTGAVLAGSALAQDYPNKPIRIVVGQGAGGGMDTLARLLGQRLAGNLGQPVVVENKVGAGGIIATEFVARAPADGYSLLMGPIGNMVFTPILVPKLRYAPVKDFVPVSLVATFPLVLVVNAKQNIHSVADLVAFMKANPSKANYGGSGPAFQFASELFRLKTGTPGEFIQYKSMSETITGLLSGDLIMSMVDTGPATPQIAAGTLRALAVTSPSRLPALPQVPTMAELGLPDIEFRYWAGIFAPAGTPAAVVKSLETEINRIVKLPDVGAQMAAIQVQASGSSSEELAKLLASDLLRWGAVADGAKMKRQE
ncbi:MAG: tripartite tricarboxylate transporter substrate binding protein [Burkholderiaceae bacterium]